MAKKGIVPSNILLLRGQIEEAYNRTEATKKDKFAANRLILGHQIRHFMQNAPTVLSFYQRYYNSVAEIDATKSKWYMEDRALSSIRDFLHAR